MKKIIQIKGAPAPIGPYSPAILKGNTLFVSGQIPLNPETGKLEIESIETACAQVMSNIGKLLNEAGMDFSHIVKTTIFLKDLNDFIKVNGTYASYFESNPPARETVEVSRLPMDVPIEISCIAIN
jgi:2-iminobutanoate/2-iminopropanoate deaminase